MFHVCTIKTGTWEKIQMHSDEDPSTTLFLHTGECAPLGSRMPGQIKLSAN